MTRTRTTKPSPRSASSASTQQDDKATLQLFGYDDATINSIGAGTKRSTADMLRKSYPDGPPQIKVVKRCWHDIALSWVACLLIVGALVLILWPI